MATIVAMAHKSRTVIWQHMITVYWTGTKNLGNKQTKRVEHTTGLGTG